MVESTGLSETTGGRGAKDAECSEGLRRRPATRIERARLRWLATLSVSIVCLAASEVRAAEVEWRVADGGNGHVYELVVGSTTWGQADAAARSRVRNGVRGHLATITSAEEQAFVMNSVLAGGGVYRAILGGHQVAGSSEPAGGWRWVTGESWDYTHWDPNEPNNQGPGPEEALEIIAGNGVWNDIGQNRVMPEQGGYIIEFSVEQGQLTTPRQRQTATTLVDGRVLTTGGYPGVGPSTSALASAEIYDPATGTSFLVGGMISPRANHVATLLDDGRVLLTGGNAGQYGAELIVDTAEVFDPTAGRFSAVANSMSSARYTHTATKLSNGLVVVIGGRRTHDGLSTGICDLFDPVAQTFTAVGQVQYPRHAHAAALLSDGLSVLIVGGTQQNSTWPVAEIYTYGAGVQTSASLGTIRAWPTADLLPDGRVLVAGGSGAGWQVTELFVPESGATAAEFIQPAGLQLLDRRAIHRNVTLSGGRVLLTGGFLNSTGTAQSSTEIFDPSTMSFSYGPTMSEGRAGHAATVLLDGRVFVAGGQYESTVRDSIDILDGLNNLAPVADAGEDQHVHPVELVQLDGTGSFDDNTPSASLVFAWTLTQRPSGSAAALGDPSSSAPTFTADVPGEYRAQLVVTDDGGLSSAADEVVISSDNVPPTAHAGPDQVVHVAATASLDGSGSSDPEHDPLTYLWVLSSAPQGSTAGLVGATTATPTLAPDVEGAYALTLVVHDGFVSSAPDTVVVTAIGPEFAQDQLGDAGGVIVEIPDDGFEAEGHRNSLTNEISQILNFVQKGQLTKSLTKLDDLITRVDGWALRGQADPKGGGQPYAADFITDKDSQLEVYALLIAARDALTEPE